MPVIGNTYTVTLRANHLRWGEIRNTNTRPQIQRETYIPIPATDAYDIGILRGDTYNFTTDDGSYSGVLRASGNQARDEYAKQFHTDRDLKDLANWLLDVCNAQEGDSVTVTWLSASDVELSHTVA